MSGVNPIASHALHNAYNLSQVSPSGTKISLLAISDGRALRVIARRTSCRRFPLKQMSLGLSKNSRIDSLPFHRALVSPFLKANATFLGVNLSRNCCFSF